MFLFSSCEKSDEIENYQISFWSNNEGEIVVTFNDTSLESKLGLITIPNETEPPCGIDGNANFSYPKGTYSWHAKINNSDNSSVLREWDGIEVIGNNSCTRIFLEVPAPVEVDCYTCTHTDPSYLTVENVCDVAGISTISSYTSLGYTCTKN